MAASVSTRPVPDSGSSQNPAIFPNLAKIWLWSKFWPDFWI